MSFGCRLHILFLLNECSVSIPYKLNDDIPWEFSGSQSRSRTQAVGVAESDRLYVLLTSSYLYVFIDHIEVNLIYVSFFLSGFRYP